MWVVDSGIHWTSDAELPLECGDLSPLSFAHLQVNHTHEPSRAEDAVQKKAATSRRTPKPPLYRSTTRMSRRGRKTQ